MAQAQLLFSEDTLSYFKQYGFENITWSPVCKEISCTLDNNFTLVLKKRRSRVKLVFKKGKNKLILPTTMFETMCSLKESVELLISFLEGQSP
jgi:hypothetical protein